jgi:uncharacterized protein involved in response to NO
MTQIPIQPPPRSADRRRFAAFALGFRPFFLTAGLAAVTLMALWLFAWHGGLTPERYYGRVGWHIHEMLWGYTVAVIAGFLLTAVRNWTGRPTATGWSLAGLVALWLGGRLLPWVPGLAPWLLAMVDMAFLPVLALSLVRPLWAVPNRPNRGFVLLLLAMAVANGMVHAEALGWISGLARRSDLLMLTLVLLTLAIVAGRVLPFFTEKALPGSRPRHWVFIERAGLVLFLVLPLAVVTDAPSALTGVLWLALALVQAIRWGGWYERRIWTRPILWVLFSGYAWMVLGLLLSGLASFGGFPTSGAIHALTVGAVGVFTLGMMARVALGHTGRPMRSATAVNLAFGILNLAAAVRVFGPFAAPTWYLSWILLSGLLWLASFSIFLAIYAPVLLRPRVDGQPG